MGPIIISDEKLQEGDMKFCFNTGEILPTHHNSLANGVCDKCKKIIAGVFGLPSIHYNDIDPHMFSLMCMKHAFNSGLGRGRSLEYEGRNGLNEWANYKSSFVIAFDINVELEGIPADRAPGGWEYFPKVTNNKIKILSIIK